MVVIVVVINTLLSLVLLYAAWRVSQLRPRITKITNWFTLAERCVHAVLYSAPEVMYISQNNIYNLRQKNQLLQLQFQQLQQIISLLVFGQRLWRRYFRRKSW